MTQDLQRVPFVLVTQDLQRVPFNIAVSNAAITWDNDFQEPAPEKRLRTVIFRSGCCS